MSRRLKQAAALILVLLAAAQLIRPDRANPPIVTSHTIAAQMGNPNGLVAVLDRACGDCHSNGTVWPWYSEVAPVSWLMAYGVKEGRKAVNFSEWTTYAVDRQRQLLATSCADVSANRMPGSAWVSLHPEARLSSQDIETICAGGHQT